MTSTATTATTADPESSSALISPQRRNFIFVAVLLGMLLAALDQTIVATALPTVVADLGGAGHQSWVVTSYLLASTIVTAVVGKLGDLFGRKAVFQTVGAVLPRRLGAVRTRRIDDDARRVARAAGHRRRRDHGHGDGRHRRGHPAARTRPLPGRARRGVRRHHRDRPAARRLLHRSPHLALGVLDQRSRRASSCSLVGAVAIPSLAKAARPVIDYAGILFVGLGASGLTLATSWGGGTYAWSSPVIIGLFVGSALALAIFVWVESRAAEPILPIRLFASPVFTVCCILGVHRRVRDAGRADVPADVHAVRRRRLGDGVGSAHPADGGGHAHHLDRQRQHRRPHRPVQGVPGRGHRDHGGGFLLLSQMDAATPDLAAVAVPVRARHRASACACRS